MACISSAQGLNQATVQLGQTVNVTFPDNGPWSSIYISGGFPNTSMAYAYQNCLQVTNASIVNNTYTWLVTQKPSWWTGTSGNLFDVPENIAFAAIRENGSGWDPSTSYTVIAKVGGAAPTMSLTKGAMLGLAFVGATSLAFGIL